MTGPWKTNRQTKGHFQQKVRVTVELTPSKVQNKVRKKIVRNIDRKKRAMLRTLENPLLWNNFRKVISKFNPHFDFDIVDRTLEWDEALNAVRRMVRDLVVGEKKFDSMQEYRHYLREEGIDNQRLQSMIMMDDRQPTEEELNGLAFLLHGRPIHAKIVDRAKKAPPAKSWREWLKHPDRTDLAGEDSIGTRTDISEKLGI